MDGTPGKEMRVGRHPDRIRILFSCTGVGILNRGIESFFRESFDALKDFPDLDISLLKGRGIPIDGEIPIPCLARTGMVAKGLGRLVRRNGYVAEQLSSFPFVVREIRRLRPHVIFYSDSSLGFQLFRWRKQIGVPFRLLFSNGGPCQPPFDRTDCVHQVAPFYYQHALGVGERADRQFMVPYGIEVPVPPPVDPALRARLRESLAIPTDRRVVLSVGWISRAHKRMDYLVQELAQMSHPRPFLVMVGAMDESSEEVLALARKLLGVDGFLAKSVPYADVFKFYQVSDVFVLASLREGFGRVYLEALMHGLPVIAHRHPVMEYVLGSQGLIVNLNRPGELAQTLGKMGDLRDGPDEKRRRWTSVKERFSWRVLAPQYAAMFRAAAG